MARNIFKHHHGTLILKSEKKAPIGFEMGPKLFQKSRQKFSRKKKSRKIISKILAKIFSQKIISKISRKTGADEKV